MSIGGAGLPDGLRAALRDALGPRVRFGVPLRRYTSFRVGGPADAVVLAGSAEDLTRALALAEAWGVPVLPLGSGTNLLVSDRGVRGVVLRLGPSFDFLRWDVEKEDARLAVGAAVRLGKLARRVAARGYCGLEFAEGIPGTVGGALVMNAGAFGGEMADVVEAVEGVTGAAGTIRVGREDLGLRYRGCSLPQAMIVTAVHLRVRRADRAVIAEGLRRARERRSRSQPARLPNAGSVFKNPPGEYAGRLIEAAGLKGVTRGGACISPQHANVIVNLGGARAADVRELVDLAQRGVWEQLGVRLEPEVRFVGEW